MANASAESLAALTEACDPATFGLGGEDVLDETYRKATKLDASKFAITFDPLRCSLIGSIKDQLLDSKNQTVKTSLDCELSKLNVCGKASLSISSLKREPGNRSAETWHQAKTHSLKLTKTPRSEKMVGSLVIVFPTPHSGGEEWTFDGASMIPAEPSPSIAYIAFYSDVEHEVLKVTCGHRVTITYSLYLLTLPVEMQEPSVPISRNVAGLTNFMGALKITLQDKDFLREGGTRGFGLQYQYPVSYRTKMEDLQNRLKGSDAHIWNVCSDLGLNPKLWITYGTSEIGVGSGYLRVLTGQYYEPRAGGMYSEGFLSMLMVRGLGRKVNVTNGADVRKRQVQGYHPSEDDDKATQVVWITPLAPLSTLERPVMAYGNEAELEFVYCDPCFLATVKPASERESEMDTAIETT